MKKDTEKLFEKLARKVVQIKHLDPIERLFLDYCLKKDYKLFLYLTPEQYTEEYASKYLYETVVRTLNFKKGFIRKSYGEQTVFDVGFLLLMPIKPVIGDYSPSSQTLPLRT